MLRKALIAFVVLVVLAAGGAYWYVSHKPLNSPRQVLTAYLQRWNAQDWSGMAALVADPPASFVPTHEAMVRTLGITGVTITASPLQVTGTARSATYSVAWDLRNLGPWAYSGTIKLAEFARRWKVVWTPATLEPHLAAGDTFTFSSTWAKRADILGRDGSVIQGSMPAEAIGVEPARIQSLPAVEAALQQYAGVPTATVTRALNAPGVQPTWFLPLTTVSMDAFNAVKGQLSPVPGILFEQSSARMPVSPGFAGPILGSTGPITADLLKQLGSPYTTGSVVGVSGLELSYERQLAGTPSTDIEILDANKKLVGGPLQHYPGTPPQPVQTTLDPTIQNAAQATLAGLPKNAALVAMDAATGEIRGVANNPAGGFDRAIAGNYPPGSTFKIITTTALLTKGLTLTSPISCPTATVVDGETFKNFEGEDFGQITLEQAFIHSCNTAYVQMAATLKPAELVAAANSLGFNTPESLGLNGSGGSFPTPRDLADQAAAAIGQSKDLTSPVQMASVAAAVASGTWHPPTLVVGATTTATAKPMDPGVAANLRTLMGEVVTQGTGTAAQLPGTPVSGKTGTAEYGSGNPLPTHAWFVGFRGSIAFAVIVEGGGVGGQVAAPLAAKFLASIPGT